MKARTDILATLSLALFSAPAAAQSTGPAVFVANDGNAEGSVSSLRIEADGTLTLVDRVITGVGDDPGTNPYTMSLSPNGRYLATGHTTISDTVEQLTIIEVGEDLLLSIAAVFTTPDSPLSVRWVTDTYLAVTKTDLGGTNEVIIYAFDAGGPTLTMVDSADVGSFTSSLAVDRARKYVFAQDSFGYEVHSFFVDREGMLIASSTVSTGGTFPLGLGLSPDGSKLYAGGGISGDGHQVLGMHVAPSTGALVPMADAPFFTPDLSPKQVVVSHENRFALIAHGTSATVRSMAIDQETGALADTGFNFAVGQQGDLGAVATMDDLVFVTDNTTAGDGMSGVYALTLAADGSLTINGGIVDTEGVGPREIAVWPGQACPGDVTGDGTVDVDDLVLLLASWGPCPPGDCPADLDGDGSVEVDDLITVLASWGGC